MSAIHHAGFGHGIIWVLQTSAITAFNVQTTYNQRLDLKKKSVEIFFGLCLFHSH